MKRRKPWDNGSGQRTPRSNPLLPLPSRHLAHSTEPTFVSSISFSVCLLECKLHDCRGFVCLLSAAS